MVLRHRRSLGIVSIKKYIRRTRRLTLFTESDLTKFVGPVLPNPIPNTRSYNDRDCDSKEYAPSRRPMFLVELITLSGARESGAFVQFRASLTS
jgi:hypothetical protein